MAVNISTYWLPCVRSGRACGQIGNVARVQYGQPCRPADSVREFRLLFNLQTTVWAQSNPHAQVNGAAHIAKTHHGPTCGWPGRTAASLCLVFFHSTSGVLSRVVREVL